MCWRTEIEAWDWDLKQRMVEIELHERTGLLDPDGNFHRFPKRRPIPSSHFWKQYRDGRWQEQMKVVQRNWQAARRADGTWHRKRREYMKKWRDRKKQ